MRSLFGILSVLIFFTSHSQPIIPRFETLGVNEGLSQNSVYAIYQDKAGYMWFGTADGLNRYDGDEIKIYKTKTELSKKGNSNFIRGKLCEDKNGNIWFSSETGIYYYDRLEDQVKLDHAFQEVKYGIAYYYLLGIDTDQTLWLGNRIFGVASWQIKHKTWNEYNFPLKTDLAKLSSIDYEIMDPQNNIWYTRYENDGMIRFNTREKKYEHVFGENDCLTICFAKGKHFITNENYIYRYDSLTTRTDSFQFVNAIKNSGNPVFDYPDSYGRLWSSSFNYGLVYFDFNSGKFHQYQRNLAEQKSLSSDIIRSLTEDRSGNLWVGTDVGGVCKLDLKPPFFNLFPTSEAAYPELKDFFIYSLFEDENKRIWIGTLGGLIIYNPSNGRIKHFSYTENNPKNLQNDIVSAIFRDRQGNMWIGNNKGIFLFEEKSRKFQKIMLQQLDESRFSSVLINKIMQLKNGAIIAASYGQLLLINKKGERKAGAPGWQTKSLVPATATDIAEISNGEIWYTTPISGIWHGSLINDSLNIKENFIPGIDLRSIHIDETAPEVLWIASGKGLIRFDTKTKKYELYNESNGMANSYIYGILEDEHHNFWMSTNGGLTYFDRQSNIFQNYTVNEGLQSNEFNTGAFYKGNSGTFYFGGVKGFNWFRTVSFPKSKTKPGIGITSILIENTPFIKDSTFFQNKTIRLNYLQNDLVFEVAVLDYTRPQANKIQYKLENWDDKWITSYNKQIRYGKLFPGRYTLIIMASNNVGEWSDEEKMTIIIDAPFWQQAWFYILFGSLLMATVILITRNLAQRKIKEKLRQLEKQQAVEAERNRISKDMHDEIGSGLTRIALMTELMQTRKQLDEKTKYDVNEIAGSSRQLVESMSEIIWTLNPHNDKLEDLLAYMREQTRHYFEPLNVSYTVLFPETIPDIKLSNEQRRNLFLVSKEALNNALKHSGANRIELIADTENGKIRFSVIDNGKGIDGATKRTGANGLRNMQQRMKDIKGDIEWISQNGNGTRVNYWIYF